VKDSFGVEIGEGDYILSASTTHGRVKVGTAYQGKNGLLMRIDISAQYGIQESAHPKSGQLGYNVVVLRKADGTVPTHVGPPVVLDPKILDSALRDYVADLDYDIHKGIESGEEDGEDHYAEHVESFTRAYEHAASKTGESE
jgi:hypothetical protein